jgi:hypothetical protein
MLRQPGGGFMRKPGYKTCKCRDPVQQLDFFRESDVPVFVCCTCRGIVFQNLRERREGDSDETEQID